MSAHYGTTFSEKFASYLIVKDITESLYNKTFMDSLDQACIVYNQTIANNSSSEDFTTDEKIKTKDYLDKLIAEIEGSM